MSNPFKKILPTASLTLSVVARLAGGSSVAAILLLTTIVALPVQAAESIDTTPNWNGSSAVAPWSSSPTESYGQIITPLEDGNLTDFTFFINPNLLTPDIAYQARVYQWDYTGGPGVWGPTGPSLYNSGTLSFSGTPGSFSEVSINTGGIAVSAGIPYVLFFSTVGETNTSGNSTSWGFIGSDVYANGDFVFSNNASSFTDPWDSSFGPGTELAFKANIAAPVPGPLPLLGVAAAFGYGRGMRRRLATQRPSPQ